MKIDTKTALKCHLTHHKWLELSTVTKQQFSGIFWIQYQCCQRWFFPPEIDNCNPFLYKFQKGRHFWSFQSLSYMQLSIMVFWSKLVTLLVFGNSLWSCMRPISEAKKMTSNSLELFMWTAWGEFQWYEKGYSLCQLLLWLELFDF